MRAYLDICREILERGVEKRSRTGVDTLAISGEIFKHDMGEGFPLLTTKKIAYKHVRSELEFFIKGLTDKKWLQDRGNHIWDEWCSPTIVPYGADEETKAKMMAERDLGPAYGWQWRHFGAKYLGMDCDYKGQGVDQLARVVETLKTDPDSRRMICMAWNPMDIDKVVPPFCHYGFQVDVIGNKLNLAWNQRSVDVPLGLPFNIASYATLLHLLAKESNLEEGMLTGFLMDTHIYENQVGGIEEQLSREPKDLPKIITENFSSIFDWDFMDTRVEDYNPHPLIKFPIAV